MGRGARSGPDGLVVVDKPPGWTSHDVVAKCRKLLGTRRVGHSGTLDPDATGVLLVGVGRVTRLLRFLTALPKSYTCEIVLGVETSTLDASGEVTATHAMAVTPDDVRVAAEALTGEILQVPPMVSAVQVGGRRLHELAREGREVERAPRPVTVWRFEVTPTGDPLVYQASVTCSSGTYVRSLAADLGAALGGGAHLRHLRRTAIGSFTEAEAWPVEQVGPEVLLAPAAALRDYPQVRVDERVAAEVGVGKVLDRSRLGVGEGEGPWAVLDAGGALLAVYELHRAGTVKPAVVVAPAGRGSSGGRAQG
ncbi:tRNA pseudouridine(55) synthase TruB [Rhabdothermincola sediminis]|uniref:tRNA pseudouridine(55) synthase TruB n=1 Tax=Rhabdothermincola sediminis TaxID=2751370 RepID=UPI001AA02579|nr:tRNA pseudouridine(55) synthase TruB [Rhabdothermincola sediminis]